MAHHDTPLGRFMELHKLTQRALADGSEITLSQINGIVRGHTKPRVDTANKLVAFCRTLDPTVTLDSLFGLPTGKRRKVAA